MKRLRASLLVLISPQEYAEKLKQHTLKLWKEKSKVLEKDAQQLKKQKTQKPEKLIDMELVMDNIKYFLEHQN